MPTVAIPTSILLQWPHIVLRVSTNKPIPLPININNNKNDSFEFLTPMETAILSIIQNSD
jgi:hypothetical protein